MTQSRWRTSRLALAALVVSALVVAVEAVVAAPAQAAPVSSVRGDWNLDGKAELLVRMPDGTLAEYVYIRGRMSYLRSLSTGFGSSARLYSPGDATYDGRTDLLVEREGTLTLYGLRSDGRLATGREVGRGFSGITMITPGTNWRDRTIQGNLTVRMYGITATGDMYLYGMATCGFTGAGPTAACPLGPSQVTDGPGRSPARATSTATVLPS